MSTEQGTTVHERLLRPYLGHCSSATPAVRWLPSAASAATPPFSVRSSGLYRGRPGGLELVTRLHSRSDAFCWQFSSWSENISFSRSANVHSLTQSIRGFAIMRYIKLLLILTLTLWIIFHRKKNKTLQDIYTASHGVLHSGLEPEFSSDNF